MSSKKGSNNNLASLLTGYVDGTKVEFVDDEHKRKPYGYWQNLDNVLLESRMIIKDNNFYTLPGDKTLARLGYSSLSRAIEKYHGGFPKIRKLLGELEKKGKWSDIQALIFEIKKVMKEYNFKKIPSKKIMIKIGQSYLSRMIDKHGGYIKIRKLFNEDDVMTQRGLWEREDYIIQKAKEAMKEMSKKVLPGSDFLSENGYSSLARAITLYHGGFSKFRIVLGESNIRTVKGTRKSLSYVLFEAKKAIKEHRWKTLPCHRDLEKFGYRPLANAIVEYHGGFSNFRKLLGEEKMKAHNGTWKSLEYAVSEAQRIMLKEGWKDLPSQKVLGNSGYSSLPTAVQKYHGGIKNFRKLLEKNSETILEANSLFSLLENYVGGKDD